MKRYIQVLLLAVMSIHALRAQTKSEERIMFKVCVDTISAYGSHVRFTSEEHIQILLNERKAKDAQEWPYREWENAAMSINWFDGAKPVSLAYVKSHMPRAMLLELRFPVDPNPHVVQADLDRLIEAERKCEEAAKVAGKTQAYLRELLKKYNIGPAAMLDEDLGGASPLDSCRKYENRWEKQK